MRISDWSSDVCSSDLRLRLPALLLPVVERREIVALSRVFIDHDGNKHPQLEDAKRTLADPGRGAVHIGRIDGDHLNLAEGFEDAESVIPMRSEEHTSVQSLMRISYAVFCLKKKNNTNTTIIEDKHTSQRFVTRI